MLALTVASFKTALSTLISIREGDYIFITFHLFWFLPKSLFSSLETAEDLLLSVHLAGFLFFFLLPPQLFLTVSSSVVSAFGVDPSSEPAVLPRSLCLSLDTSTWTCNPLPGLLQKEMEKESGEGSPGPTSKETKVKTWPTSHCPSGKQRCLIKRGGKRGTTQKPRPLMFLRKDVTQGRRSSASQHPAFSRPTEGTAGNHGPAFPRVKCCRSFVAPLRSPVAKVTRLLKSARCTK